MFRWLTGPDVPPADVVDWLFDTFDWLLAEAGGWARFEKMRLVLPTPEFFPVASDDARLADDMLAQIKLLADMRDWPVRLTMQEDAPTNEQMFGQIALGGARTKSAAGTFRGHGGNGLSSEITYAPNLLRQPQSLVATLAHELGHYLLSTAKNEPPGGWEMEEPATDACAVFMGFGVFLANSSFHFGRTSGARWGGWRASQLGYLNEQTLAYALGLFLRLRGLDPQLALRHLTTNPRAYLKDALYDLERGRASRFAEIKARR
jgi:hypothetical protein